MHKIPKHNRYFLLSLITFVILGSFLARGYVFPTGNHYTHVPQIKAMLNPELYNNDYYVREMMRFTPRYYYQLIVAALAKLTGSIAASYFIYYLLAFTSFIAGCFSLGKLFTRSKLAAATVAFLSLTAYTLIGYIEIFTPRPVPAAFAMSLSVWGLYFGFRQRWFIGYLFFGIASLLQFLIGVLPGLMMLPIMAFASYKKRPYKQLIPPLLIFFGMAALIYLPMALSGTTSTDKIGNAEFVFIYGWVRNPHHIIPSYWSLGIWIDFLLFIAGGLLCIWKSDFASATLRERLKKNYKLYFYIIVAESIFALFLNYLFIEIYPLAIVAKLQLARTVPFAQIIIFIAVASQVDSFYKKGRLELSLLLLISLTFPWPYRGIWFLLISIALLTNLGKRYLLITRSKLFPWVLVVLSLIFSLISSPPISLDKPILFLILAFPFLLGKISTPKKNATHALALLTATIFILGLLDALPGKISNIFQQQVKTYQIPQDDPTKLALRFSKISDKNAIILVPPFVSNFQFYSERAVVVDFKHFPQTDDGIRQWKRRMEAVFGVPLSPQLAIGSMEILFPKRSSLELVNVAREYGADYILTRVDWHPDINGIVVDKEGKWVIYKIRE
jgi:hypothetical protein